MKRFKNLIVYIASLILVFPLILLLVLFCVIYRICVILILKQTYGNKFGEMLSGVDRVFILKNDWRNVVNILLMVEFENENFYELLKKLVFEKVFANPEKLIKCTGIHKSAYGYSFILKNEYNVDECVRKLNDEVENEEDLQKVLSKYAYESLPKNDGTFWEILICQKAIQWRNNEKKCIPVIIRCNHAIGDALSMASVLIKTFEDPAKMIQDPSSLNRLLKVWNTIILGLKSINFLTLIPLILFNKQPDFSGTNSIHGPELSGTKVLVWKILEHPILDQIKQVKNSISNGRFGSVWFTAISASFEKYFEKYANEVPEEFVTSSAVHLGNLTEKDKISNLTNSIGLISFPIPIRWESSFLTDRLKEINKRYNDELNGYYAQIKLVDACFLTTVLPKPLLMKTLQYFDCTVLNSNLLTLPSFTILNGHKVVDIVGWINNFARVGIGIAYSAYGGNRMQLSLIADAVLIDSKEKAHEILNNCSKYINEMYFECNTSFEIL